MKRSKIVKPIKRWNRWEITYRIPGYTKLFSERFDTIEEANIRHCWN